MFSSKSKMASKKVLAPKMYQRFLQVCEQWPIDKSKGTDLGVHLKQNFGPSMKNTNIDPPEAEKMLDSLVKISSNYYRNKYPRKHNTAFSTDDPAEAGAVLSQDFQKEISKKSPMRSMFSSFLGKKE